jgi:hypothetical protein
VTGDDTSHEHTPTGQFAAAIQLQWPQEKDMTGLTDNMIFGTFMAPFHRVGENPTLALERDVELIEWLDDLGFDEAWIGEHHSGGWETIASVVDEGRLVRRVKL